MNKLPPLDEWLGKHGPEIEELIEFSKCYLDPKPELLNEAGADINAKAANAGFLLADAEVYLIFEKGRHARNMPEGMGPTAQKVYVEEKTAELRRLRDQLKVIVRSLRSLSISVCSLRKSARI